MKHRIYIFSDKVLKGFSVFDFDKAIQIFAKTITEIESVEFLPIEKSKGLNLDNNNIIFSENENIDDLIINFYSQLGQNKEIIDEQIVVFSSEKEKTIFMPLESNLDLLYKVLKTDNKFCQFHVFGMNKNVIIEKLDNLKNEIPSLKFKIVENNILCDIYLSYSGENDLIDDNLVKIASVFKANMYSENELNLETIVYQLLKMKNLSISICENVTQGKILSALLENNNLFSSVLKTGKIEFYDKPDNNFLHNRSMKLLEESGSDLAIVTYGEMIEDKFSFIFTLADKKEVHFYKCNFSGNINNSIEMAKNTLLYHLVKKLRQNDFAF